MRAGLRTPAGALSLAALAALVVLAVVAPVVWGGEAARVDVAHLLEPGSAAHPLGTDALGRDNLARVLVATRDSLLLAVLATVVAAGIGIPFGALPAVLGRRGARAANALIDFSVAFPALLLAIFLAVVLGVGARAAVLAIGIASAPSFARLTQTLAASVGGSDYVAAARVVGVGRWRLLTRHVLPNIAEPLILNTTIAAGYALLAISGLSFLGLGTQPPAYDWGRLLDEALPRIYVTPEAALGPVVAIVAAGLAFNTLGEALARGTARRPVRRAGARAAPAAVVPPAGAALLDVAGLTVSFAPVDVVRGVSLSVEPGEIVGIVGESGSGKSLTALAIAQLAPGSVGGAVSLWGRDVRVLSRRELGTSVAMVFQDPGTSLNPALRIGRQLAEVLEVHAGARRAEATGVAVDRLRSVRIARPEARMAQYPHELSGGMRQRVMIAMGLMGEPDLIIADEPTSALDVTVQQQILRLLDGVSAESGAAVIFISHDMAVVAGLCGRVLVMYAGRVVEELDAGALLGGAAHPYTRALVASVPDMAADRSQPLATIPGRPPEPGEVGDGCAFAPRCAFAGARCHVETPVLRELGARQRVACWFPRA
ncbi:MAG TPA: dipeptide/oligopeptide/nickel ABC transporter permease/ATP-binding protein [Solirubrobacteraceae bacterium]|nr:dipeptide/oligopeptide/nickel ABC transporter permease/ATP-binding protein [Solirubrobacteraceae bacterium]